MLNIAQCLVQRHTEVIDMCRGIQIRFRPVLTVLFPHRQIGITQVQVVLYLLRQALRFCLQSYLQYIELRDREIYTCPPVQQLLAVHRGAQPCRGILQQPVYDVR